MMNYFELYEIPVSFHPDPSQVKSKFYELSRKYHPDRFTLSDEATKAEALRMSALNNDAYKVLGNTDAVMAYILKLNYLLKDEEKYALPPDFLMEMMELNETVSEYEMQPGSEAIKIQATSALQEQLSQWENDTNSLVSKYDRTSPDNELLLKIKDQYFRKKYLLRIKERIDRFAAR